MHRVSKILIGKNIARTGTTLHGAGQDVLDGEIFVLDKNMSIATAGMTISDTDIIYIAQFLGDTVSYKTLAVPTGITEKKMIISNPIKGSNVKSYIGKAYESPVEKVITITASTPVIGQEYIVRVVYIDKAGEGYDGQTTQEWRLVATTAVTATHCTAFAALINLDSNSRITAAGVGGTITITANSNNTTENLTDIGPYFQANFEVAYNTVVLDVTSSAASSITTSTQMKHGTGSWRQIRDIERSLKGNRGHSNPDQYPNPSIESTFYTVKGTNYDQISIEHDASYGAADNNYIKETGLSTIIAIPEPAGQTANVLGVLNPWMASCPGSFANVVL
ncbi:hypothetical protein CCP3SC1AL1_310003 [Gammaproteobacteria bacterium]